MNTLDCATVIVETIIHRDRKYGGRANYKTKLMQHVMLYVPGFNEDIRAKRYDNCSRKIRMVGRVWDLLRCANIVTSTHINRPAQGWIRSIQLKHFCLYNMGTVQRMAHIKKHLLMYLQQHEGCLFSASTDLERKIL